MIKYVNKKHVIDIPGFNYEVELRPKSRAKMANKRRNIITSKAALPPPVAKPHASPHMMQVQAASVSGRDHWMYLDPPGIWIRIG